LLSTDLKYIFGALGGLKYGSKEKQKFNSEIANLKNSPKLVYVVGLNSSRTSSSKQRYNQPKDTKDASTSEFFIYFLLFFHFFLVRLFLHFFAPFTFVLFNISRSAAKIQEIYSDFPKKSRDTMGCSHIHKKLMVSNVNTNDP
jgi:hypothetical protein